ncbi:MAG: hypothetical protein JW993_19580, partial [Sedimentisphaerales bacterium]|nr:hypothetical protein [Sedimentisphaerales bacterium]
APRGVDWLKGRKMVEEKEPIRVFEGFLFPRIFQAFRMSIQPTKLILAFVAVAAICLAGRIMDVSQTVVVRPGGTTELDEFMDPNGTGVARHIRLFAAAGERTGVFATLWSYQARQFHEVLYGVLEFDVPKVRDHVGNYFQAFAWALLYHPGYTIILFAICLAVISLVGGAICRIAALQFAQGEKPGLTEALRFGARKFYSFLTAPLTPVGIIVVTGVSVVLLGLVGNIRYVGELSVGVFLPLALLAAALTTIIAIGAVAGLNLMFPTIAYEDSDCFDAISRSFSYVYAKPWRMGFYTVVAVGYGAICYLFVRCFCYLVLAITHVFLKLGFVGENAKLNKMWPGPAFADLRGVAAAPENWSTSAAAFLIDVWVLVVVGLMVAFVISFYFSANTIIYALMRNRVDKTSLEEVYTYAGEFAAGPDVPPPGAEGPSDETTPAKESKPKGKSEASE